MTPEEAQEYLDSIGHKVHPYWLEIVGSSVEVDRRTGKVVKVHLGGPHITEEDVLNDLSAAWPGFGQDIVNKEKGLPGMFDLPNNQPLDIPR